MKKKEKRTFKQFFMDNNKRNLKITITVVCVVLALAIIGGGIYIGNKLGLITIDHGSNGDPEGTFAPEEQFDAMYDVGHFRSRRTHNGVGEERRREVFEQEYNQCSAPRR